MLGRPLLGRPGPLQTRSCPLGGPRSHAREVLSRRFAKRPAQAQWTRFHAHTRRTPPQEPNCRRTQMNSCQEEAFVCSAKKKEGCGH